MTLLRVIDIETTGTEPPFESITYEDVTALIDTLNVAKLISRVGITSDTGLPFVEFNDGTAEIDTPLARTQAQKWFGLTFGEKDEVRVESRHG